jgi:high-affinity iron transporter
VGYLVFLISIGGLYFRSIMGGNNQKQKNIPVAEK